VAAEVGGVDEVVADGGEFGHESLAPARPIAGQVGVADGEVERVGEAGYVGRAGAVHDNAPARIVAEAAQVGRVDQRGAAGGELGDEGVRRAVVGGLEGIDDGEVERESVAGDIRLPRAVHGNGE